MWCTHSVTLANLPGLVGNLNESLSVLNADVHRVLLCVDRLYRATKHEHRHIALSLSVENVHQTLLAGRHVAERHADLPVAVWQRERDRTIR